MGDRKRPGLQAPGLSEPPTSKATRCDAHDAQRRDAPLPTLSTRGRGGRRRGRGKAPPSRGGAPGVSPVSRPINHPSLSGDVNRLLNAVTSSSLFYESCRSSIIDAFPEHVPSTFQDADHYVRTFLPLLYEEARESIKASFSDAREQDQYWDASVLSVETQGAGWVKVDVMLGRFYGRHATNPRLFQNHVAVLTSFRPPKRDPVEHLQKKLKKQTAGTTTPSKGTTNPQMVPATVVVAIVVQLDRDKNVLTLRTRPVCDQHPFDTSAPCHQCVERLRQFPGSWFVFPTGGLVTQQRECDILHSLEKIPVMQAILKPDQCLKMKIEEVPRKLPTELGNGIQDYMRQTYDASQADAILMCTAHFCKDEIEDGKQTLPVLLIQGPPGTGKTHTVEGILNLWHLVQFERYYKRVIGQYRCADSTVMKKSELATTRTLMKPRILVCAPSNAAVDELLERILMHGFRDSSGQVYKPNLVRIGAEDAQYSDDVRLVFLDTLVASYLSMNKNDWLVSFDKYQQRVQLLEKEIKDLEQMILRDERSIETSGGELLSRMEKLDKSETEIRRLKLVESVVDGTCPNDRYIREALELNFLDSAEMVFTTLSSTGKKVLSKVNRGFETVLIDEAAQASEVSTLQPLVYGCQQCVLVGDPQQLPATILSQRGKALNMERSLFGRLQEGGAPVKLLQTQYRMHPYIRSFPSSYFYDNQLEDGQNIKDRPQEPFYNHDLLKPYVIFNVPTGLHERQGGGSLQNQVEADLAAALFKELRDFLIEKHQKALQEGKPSPRPVRVGVLTPYRSQTKCLTDTFFRLLGADVASEVKILTVDSCQGKQLDVVIFSCVRGSTKASGVGFVADIRRMNVAITRAKKALWILGNFRTLVSHPAWAALEADAKERECVIDDSTAESLFPHQNLFKNTRPPPPPLVTLPLSHSHLHPFHVMQIEDMAEYKDPRVGVIKPLTEGEKSEPENTDGTSQTTTEDTQKEATEAHQHITQDAVNSMSLEQLHRLQDTLSSVLQSRTQMPSAAVASQPVVSAAEGCSVSTAASETDRETSQLFTTGSSSFMLIRQDGAGHVIGPSQDTSRAFLLVDTPQGLTSFPIEILLHARQGFDPAFLSSDRSNASNTAISTHPTAQMIHLIQQWLMNRSSIQ